jgi:hypothetical protein
VDYFPDSQLRNELIGRLRDKYITDREDWPHLSEVIYCLTKSYFERTDPIQVTEKELLYFSIGFALEDVLLRIRWVDLREGGLKDGCNSSKRILT